MKVLILTGKFGMGHYSAAQTIAAQLEAQLGDVEAVVVDLVSYILEESSVGLYRMYGTFVNRTSGAFNWLYKATEKGELQGRLPMAKTMAAAVAELVEETGAEVIIATHSASVMAASEYKRRRASHLPLITCITDVVCHSNWVTAETDWYLVASPYSKELLVEKGVAPEQILVSGIPVKPVFKNLPKFGRKNRNKQLLIMGGGCGLLPKDKSFYERLNELPKVEVTILAGSNRSLLSQLEGRYEHITVLGYTNEVPKLMARADVVISKPGGLSVFEAIYAEKPLLLFAPKLEQEKRNGLFMMHSGMAQVLSGGPLTAAEIASALQDEVGLKRMQVNMRRFKAELDQLAVVKLVASFGQKGLVQC